MPAAVWLASPVQASTTCVPNTGGFEIDGDMLAGDCTTPGDDWNTPNLGVQVSSQGGTYSTSSKDKDPTSGWTSSGSTPSKTDFQRAYAVARVVNGHYFVYVAWERTFTNGTQGYAIEIDNAPTNVAPDGTPQPNRSSGGYVFYISSQGGASPQFAGECTFSSQNDYGSTCGNPVAGFAGAFNNAAITDPLNGNASVSAGGFYEISLDVTALTGIAPSCPGASAASAYLRSITGQTSTGNLKGYMAPFTLQPNSTCVAPTIDTTADPGGSANPPGTQQVDHVTVGTQAAPGVGTVQFVLCNPADVLANQQDHQVADCAIGGTDVGNPVTLAADGTGTSPAISGATDTTTGTYCWRAEFTPNANDHHYLAGSHTNSTTECFTIVFAHPTLTTQVALQGGVLQNGDGSLGITALSDTATLHNAVTTATYPVDGTTVNFSLWGPFADGVTPVCTGQPAFTTTGTVTSGSATTAASFTPTQAGNYYWTASWNGTPLNAPAADQCGEATEHAKIDGAVIDVAKSANPPGPVSAGETIGFDITVTNEGSVPALNTTVTDTLPSGADGVAGGDLNWTLDPSYTGCTINGSPGSQTLTCNLGTVNGPGSLPVIHISSPTTSNDCGVVKNKASVGTSNGTGGDSDVATVTVLCPHITVTKTADDTSVSAGDPIGFHVTVTSDGPAGSTAKNVQINDPLPGASGVSWSVESGAANCSITGSAPQVLHCSGVDLPSGQSYTVHVTSATSDASCTTLTNTAIGTADNAGQSQDTASVTVECPDVTLTKSADALTVDAGTSIGFTVTATNSNAQGTGTAHGVVIDDPLPAGTGVDWSIDSGPANCSITGAVGSQVLHCTAVDLAPGEHESVHVTSGTVFDSCKTYDNTAHATATNQAAIGDASASVTVQCANLVLTKTADHNDPVDVGTTIGFTVTIHNSGPADAHGVDVEDALPTGPGITWTVDAAGTSGPLSCSVTASQLKCTGDLANGATEVVHITSPTVWEVVDNQETNSCTGGDGHGVYNNTASATWTNGPSGGVDSNPAHETVVCPDLSLTKSAGADSVSAGDPISFTLELQNGGPGGASGVSLSDPLPTGPAGSDVSWSIQSQTIGGTDTDVCSITGGVLTCTVGSAPNGFDLLVTVVSSTTKVDCGTYDNTATFAAGNAPDGSSNQASTAVLCPNPKITKTADADSVADSQPIGFTIAVTNDDSGSAPIGRATNVVLSDPLPTGPDGSGVQWTVDSVVIGGVDQPTACTIGPGPDSAQTLTCLFGDLAPGEVASVHVFSNTQFTSCGVYANTATATGDNADPIAASAVTSVQCPALALVVKADAPLVSGGNDLGFTLTGSNPAQVITPDSVAHQLAALNAVQGPAVALPNVADPTIVPGAALNTKLVSNLPGGSGVRWSISPAYSGQGSCAITGDTGSQVLTCNVGTLLPQASFSVHILGSTQCNSQNSFDDLGTLSASNTPSVTSSDKTAVEPACEPEPPQPPAATGVPVEQQLGWAAGLIVAGLLALMAAAIRRRRAS